MRRRKADALLCLLVLLAAALAAGIAFPRGEPAVAAAKAVPKPEHAPGSEPLLEHGLKPAAAGEAREPRGRQPTPAPAAIAGIFAGRAAVIAAPGPQRQHPSPAPVERADWLHWVGGFEDGEGRGWILVKDERRGAVIKLRADGVAGEEGRLVDAAPEALLVELGLKLYSIKGR
jgi:hypothetical protein